MSVRFCDVCRRLMVMDLAGDEPQWRCPYGRGGCTNVEPLSDEETLLMRGTGGKTLGGAGNAHIDNGTLFRTFVSLAGKDPTCKKVHGWCAKEKKMRNMSRIFLGTNEQVVYSCGCGESYSELPERPA
jgi:hypothetical protein